MDHSEQPSLIDVDAVVPAPVLEHRRVVLESIDADGTHWVQPVHGERLRCACDLLETSSALPNPWIAGDQLLALIPKGCSGRGIVLGRVASSSSVRAASVVVEGGSSALTLRCGEASLTLRADGQVLLKGEDVTVRAKGTQRIRAGNVAIN